MPTRGSDLAGRQGVPRFVLRPFANSFYVTPTPSIVSTSESGQLVSAFRWWLPDAASSAAMTLTMTLDASHARERPRGYSIEDTNRSCPSGVALVLTPRSECSSGVRLINVNARLLISPASEGETLSRNRESSATTNGKRAFNRASHSVPRDRYPVRCSH